jgi:hypothetical protein
MSSPYLLEKRQQRRRQKTETTTEDRPLFFERKMEEVTTGLRSEYASFSIIYRVKTHC